MVIFGTLSVINAEFQPRLASALSSSLFFLASLWENRYGIPVLVNLIEYLEGHGFL